MHYAATFGSIGCSTDMTPANPILVAPRNSTQAENPASVCFTQASPFTYCPDMSKTRLTHHPPPSLKPRLPGACCRHPPRPRGRSAPKVAWRRDLCDGSDVRAARWVERRGDMPWLGGCSWWFWTSLNILNIGSIQCLIFCTESFISR